MASNRVDYGDEAQATDIREILKKSHKSMLRKLIHGVFDEAIVAQLGEVVPQHVSPPSRVSAPVRPEPSPVEDVEARGREEPGVFDLADIDRILEEAGQEVSGTLALALVDVEAGLCLSTYGTDLDIEVAAAAATETMKSKIRFMEALGLEEPIEDVLLTVRAQHHVMRPVGADTFLYLAVDRTQCNLALARHKLTAAAAKLEAMGVGVSRRPAEPVAPPSWPMAVGD